MDLLTSDISYLKDCEPSDVADINTIDITDTGILTQTVNNSTADYSGELRQQFSHLNIPSESCQTDEVSQENHFVQACGQAQLAGLINGQSISELTQGLKVVGSITVPFSSSVSNTTNSYATVPAQNNQDVVSTNTEVSNVNSITDGLLHDQVAHICSQKPVIGIPLHIASKTTEAPNVFVVSMTLENNNQNKAEDAKMKINPLETTITTVPEPQRASTPNVTDEHFQIMDETIVAGFDVPLNLKKTSTELKIQKSCKDIEVNSCDRHNNIESDGNVIMNVTEKTDLEKQKTCKPKLPEVEVEVEVEAEENFTQKL